MRDFIKTGQIDDESRQTLQRTLTDQGRGDDESRQNLANLFADDEEN
jgi:hypothetical protein